MELHNQAKDTARFVAVILRQFLSWVSTAASGDCVADVRPVPSLPSDIGETRSTTVRYWERNNCALQCLLCCMSLHMAPRVSATTSEITVGIWLQS